MFGTRYVSEWGIIAPLLTLLLPMIGVIVGFAITIKLLERWSMLPGLPISIFMGITGFGIAVLILNFA